jgi:signal transduction histidine kinase
VSEPDLAVLAHARHELRTPLGHIIGYSEMLLEEVEDAGPERWTRRCVRCTRTRARCSRV